MCPYKDQIEKIKNQIIEKYNPKKIILFGSCAKGVVHKNSDIDLCIITKTEDKRKLVQDIMIEVEYDAEIEVVIYTPEEWEKFKDDETTFAGIINKTGVSLIG